LFLTLSLPLQSNVQRVGNSEHYTAGSALPQQENEAVVRVDNLALTAEAYSK